MHHDITRTTVRAFSYAMVGFALVFLVNNVLIFWFDWPGMFALLGQLGMPGLKVPRNPVEGSGLLLGAVQTLSYTLAVVLPIIYSLKNPHGDLRVDAQRLSEVAAFIIRTAFWGVVMIGIVDSVISFLRVENFLPAVVGEQLSKDLGRSIFRGSWVHYPLLLVAMVVAWRVRSIGFIWLGLLVVFAEFSIVLTRFIFSYEQAFMGDLVRFWYAGLFLFASAYALVNEGHVRVDVLYAHFSRPRKAMVNLFGSLFLGLPLCWIILSLGMWKKSSSLNSPLVTFEISQSGYGLYVKYLMAGFMVVFAVSMIVQFSSYMLSSLADIRNDPDASEDRATTV